MAAVIVVAVAFFARPDLASPAVPPPLPNVWCPVQSHRAAVAEFSATYKGREVYFCCRQCQVAFTRDPERYAGALPPPLPDDGPRSRLVELRDRHTLALAAVAAIGGWLLIAHRRRRGRYGWTAALVVLQTAVIADLLRSRPEAAPARPAVADDHGEAAANYALLKHAFRALAPKLSVLERTYYRGNDERDPRLFNGGAYRTATFHLSIVGPDGTTLRVGDRVQERALAVQLVIDRAAGTAPEHFHEATMARFRLVAAQWRPRGRPGLDGSGRREDGAPLEHLVPGWKWQLRYPIGTAPPSNVIDGVLYVTNHNARAASYAVHYRVATTADTRVAPGSSVFMSAVYGEDFQDPWLSEMPIPEIVGENVKDPVLLGLVPGANTVDAAPAVASPEPVSAK